MILLIYYHYGRLHTEYGKFCLTSSAFSPLESLTIGMEIAYLLRILAACPCRPEAGHIGQA